MMKSAGKPLMIVENIFQMPLPEAPNATCPVAYLPRHKRMLRLLALLLGLSGVLLPPVGTLPALYAQFGPEICGDGIDNDSDFLVDYEDPDCNTSDDDQDGITDIAEGNLTADSDLDGDPDSRDLDSDNDGVPDAVEGHDANRDGVADVLPRGVDADSDGLDDAYDPDQGGTVAPLPDGDGDGTPDFRDSDDDEDSIPTVAEDPNNDGDPTNDDTDGDGIPNYLDADDDNDGLLTRLEDANGDGNPTNDDGNNDGIADYLQANDRVTGVVWRDQNGDGLRSLSDPFVPNVTVVLISALTQTPVVTTTSTITGWYQLTAPTGGEYTVAFLSSSNFLPTLRDQGNNDNVDSDILGVSDSSSSIKGRSAILTLGYAGLEQNVDAGFILPAVLNVFVFDDLNRDGTRQVGEALLAGSVVILIDAGSQEVARSAPENNGNIRFANLLPGQYSLEIIPPNLYQVDWLKLLPVPRLTTGDDLRYEVPLYLNAKAVTLTSFTALYQKATIQVDWVTSVELRTQGYHLYQGTDDIFDHAQRMTTAMVLGQGSNGGDYLITFPYDPAYDAPLETVRFWLVETEISGQELRYGPVRVRQIVAPTIFLPVIRAVR